MTGWNIVIDHDTALAGSYGVFGLHAGAEGDGGTIDTHGWA